MHELWDGHGTISLYINTKQRERKYKVMAMLSDSDWFGEDLYLKYKEGLFYQQSPYLYYSYRLLSGLLVAFLTVFVNVIVHYVLKFARRLLQPWSHIEQIQTGMDLVFGAYHILATAITAYVSERKISLLCEWMRNDSGFNGINNFPAKPNV